MNVTVLQKPSSSINAGTSSKYFINYDKKLKDTNFVTQGWLQVLKRLKPTNFDDKNRVLLGVLEKRDEIVIKISNSNTLKKEYEFGKLLKTLPGFMKYITYFECEDDYKKYPGSKDYLCESDGKSMAVLVMPYVRNGSMYDFEWTKDNLELLKSCIRQTMLSMMIAFDKFQFIHNDTHTKNIMLCNTTIKTLSYDFSFGQIQIPCNKYKTVFMDFENSLRGDNINFVYNDMGRLCADINYNMKLHISGLIEMMTYFHTLRGKQLTRDIVDTVLKKIDKLEWGGTLVMPNFGYNPNRF